MATTDEVRERRNAQLRARYRALTRLASRHDDEYHALLLDEMSYEGYHARIEVDGRYFWDRDDGRDGAGDEEVS